MCSKGKGTVQFDALIGRASMLRHTVRAGQTCWPDLIETSTKSYVNEKCNARSLLSLLLLLFANSTKSVCETRKNVNAKVKGLMSD